MDNSNHKPFLNNANSSAYALKQQEDMRSKQRLQQLMASDASCITCRYCNSSTYHALHLHCIKKDKRIMSYNICVHHMAPAHK